MYKEYAQNVVTRLGGNELWYEQFNPEMDYNNLNKNEIPNGNYSVIEHDLNGPFKLPHNSDLVHLELDIDLGLCIDPSLFTVCKNLEYVELKFEAPNEGHQTVTTLLKMDYMELYTYYIMNNIKPFIYQEDEDESNTRARIDFPYKTRNTNSKLIMLAANWGEFYITTGTNHFCKLLIHNEYATSNIRRQLSQIKHPDIQELCKTLCSKESVYEEGNYDKTIEFDLNEYIKTFHMKYIVLCVGFKNYRGLIKDVKGHKKTIINRIRYIIDGTEVRNLSPHFMRRNKTLKRVLPYGMYALSFVNSPDQYKNFMLSERDTEMKLCIDYRDLNRKDVRLEFKLISVEQQFMITAGGFVGIKEPNVQNVIIMGDNIVVPLPREPIPDICDSHNTPVLIYKKKENNVEKN